MLSIVSIPDIKEQLAKRFKEKRLFLNLTQSTLAKNSGVSEGSIKRFEAQYEISLSSLLQLAMVLGCLEDFTNICSIDDTNAKNITELINKKVNNRQRGQL